MFRAPLLAVGEQVQIDNARSPAFRCGLAPHLLLDTAQCAVQCARVQLGQQARHGIAVVGLFDRAHGPRAI